VKKPDELRRVLLAHVPALKANPDRLSLFIDQGRIQSRPGALAFVYGYRLNLVVQDYAGEVDDLIVPVLAWIGEAQPDLLQRAPGEPFTFAAELIDENSADVSIYIDLTEDVIVHINPEGGFSTEHLAEPGDTDIFPDVGCSLLRQLKANGEIIAESQTPPGQ